MSEVKKNEGLERIIGLENEVNENLFQIEKLEWFIENMCDSEEDEEQPLSEIEKLKDDNDELHNEIGEFYDICFEKKNKRIDELQSSIYNLNKHLSDLILNVKLIPNPNYMIEPNNSEMMWSEDDTHMFNLLEINLKNLKEELQTIKN